MSKPWIWTIHGLRYSKHGSALARKIYGLLAQSVDYEKWKAQSMDSDNPVILTYTIQQAVWARKSCRHEAIWSPITAKSDCSFLDWKVGKIHVYCLKDGRSFKQVQTIALSWLNIQVQHNFNVAAKATFLIWAQNLVSALCDHTHFHRPT